VIDMETDVSTAIKAKDGKLYVTRTQDVEPYLEENTRERNSHSDWRPYASGRREKPLRKVAEIPNIVVEQWLNEGINIFSPDPGMQRAFRRKLDDYTYQKLRTMPGRVGMRTRHF
jgi:hypothetical protein